MYAFQLTSLKNEDGFHVTRIGLQTFGIKQNEHYKIIRQQNGKMYRHVFQWNDEYVLHYQGLAINDVRIFGGIFDPLPSP